MGGMIPTKGDLREVVRIRHTSAKGRESLVMEYIASRFQSQLRQILWNGTSFAHVRFLRPGETVSQVMAEIEAITGYRFVTVSGGNGTTVYERLDFALNHRNCPRHSSHQFTELAHP